MTVNLRTIDTVPLRMIGGDPPALLEVRGEVYLPLSGFRELNERLAGTGAEARAEPAQRGRRARCGRRTRSITASRPLAIWAYGVGRTRGARARVALGDARLAARARLSHEPAMPSGSRRSRRSRRPATTGSTAALELDYEIDGIVVKVDSLAQQAVLGALHSRPRWARAFKWAPMTAQTKLLKIAIRVGRTGALNPWAVLEPVEVGGVTVSRATLHNEEDINRKEIREGDVVIVQRAGDVIPQVVGPGRAARARDAASSGCRSAARSADTPIVKPEGEAMHRCPNRACPSRGLETLINWVQAAADIEGVGEQFVRRLWDAGPPALDARPLPADRGAAARARRLRRDLGAGTRSPRSRRRGRSRSGACSSGSTSRTSAG